MNVERFSSRLSRVDDRDKEDAQDHGADRRRHVVDHHASPDLKKQRSMLLLAVYRLFVRSFVRTFPERLVSSDPTAEMRLGIMRGRIKAFNILRNKFPTYAMYITSRSVHSAEGNSRK